MSEESVLGIVLCILYIFSIKPSKVVLDISILKIQETKV